MPTSRPGSPHLDLETIEKGATYWYNGQFGSRFRPTGFFSWHLSLTADSAKQDSAKQAPRIWQSSVKTFFRH